MVTAGDSSGDYEVDHHRETAHKHHRELDHRPWIRRSGERHLEEEILEVGLRGLLRRHLAQCFTGIGSTFPLFISANMDWISPQSLLSPSCPTFPFIMCSENASALAHPL